MGFSIRCPTVVQNAVGKIPEVVTPKREFSLGRATFAAGIASSLVGVLAAKGVIVLTGAALAATGWGAVALAVAGLAMILHSIYREAQAAKATSLNGRAQVLSDIPEESLSSAASEPVEQPFPISRPIDDGRGLGTDSEDESEARNPLADRAYEEIMGPRVPTEVQSAPASPRGPSAEVNENEDAVSVGGEPSVDEGLRDIIFREMHREVSENSADQIEGEPVQLQPNQRSIPWKQAAIVGLLSLGLGGVAMYEARAKTPVDMSPVNGNNTLPDMGQCNIDLFIPVELPTANVNWNSYAQPAVGAYQTVVSGVENVKSYAQSKVSHAFGAVVNYVSNLFKSNFKDDGTCPTKAIGGVDVVSGNETVGNSSAVCTVAQRNLRDRLAHTRAAVQSARAKLEAKKQEAIVAQFANEQRSNAVATVLPFSKSTINLMARLGDAKDYQEQDSILRSS